MQAVLNAGFRHSVAVSAYITAQVTM